MARPGPSSCSRITGRTWWPSGPGCATGCAGTCTSSIPGSMSLPAGCAATTCWTARLAVMDGVVARIAAGLVARCRELTGQVNALERELGTLVRQLAPALLAIPGCGVL